MKKYLIVLAVALFVFVGCATSSGNVSVEPFQEVIEVADTSADELFIKANQWAVGAFNKANSVIEFSDKESGIITGKYVEDVITNVLFGYHTKLTTIMNIETKDNKVRITLTLGNAEALLYNGRPSGYPIGETEITQLKNTWSSLANDLKISLVSESTDW